MTSYPHNLFLDTQPRFGLTQSDFFNFYNFLINQQIFMKIVAKCSAFASFSYQVQVKICNPIPLIHSLLYFACLMSVQVSEYSVIFNLMFVHLFLV